MSAADHGHPDAARLVAAVAGRLRLRRHEREHLVACAACASRNREWADGLAASRAAAQAEADAAFPPSRLARQRDAILRRLQSLEPARVIAFPGAPAIGAARPRRSRVRWVAAAAAAGLVLAAFTGQYVGLVPRHAPRHGAGAAVPSRAVRLVAAEPRAMALTEDEFLLQVDDAIGKPRVAELREIDDLTPRVRDASIRIR